ncbi:MAG: preprotein translocase subunit SecG [Phycisphaerales bacterium JB058]
MVLTLGMAYWMVSLLVALFLLICVVLILTVLIQRPQGGGLGGAFGAGGGSGSAGQTAFGARTGDALTMATIGMFVIYLVVAVLLNYAARPAEGVPEETTITAPGGATSDAPAGEEDAAATPDDAGDEPGTDEPASETPDAPIPAPEGDEPEAP